jgi:hypothetical protein
VSDLDPNMPSARRSDPDPYGKLVFVATQRPIDLCVELGVPVDQGRFRIPLWAREVFLAVSVHLERDALRLGLDPAHRAAMMAIIAARELSAIEAYVLSAPTELDALGGVTLNAVLCESSAGPSPHNAAS